ncbi:hypothetical protein OG689_39020 [Kitasatospora sp. NBC_00240]|uniref:hypothetical protein n=1 Tax=Kitasatospora sp. NBC_00240 TaxID=2903567 RepID=UPI0022565141|nr:hypothetical protein [Kitasatospora sp. NBC_00240]MCX5215187.1 hypothetical protein [Kitasatospora sp. NBC_00240]
MPTMTCEGCGRQVPWNPFSCCSWTCFTRPRDPDEEMTEVAAAAPAALAYFFRLRRGYRVHDGLPRWALGGTRHDQSAGSGPRAAGQPSPAQDSTARPSTTQPSAAQASAAARLRAPYRPSWAGDGNAASPADPLAMVWLSRTGGRSAAGPEGPAAAVKAAVSDCRRWWGRSMHRRPRLEP